MRVSAEFGFSASHEVSMPGGPCQGLHGHDYRVRITLDRPFDPSRGLAADYGELRDVFQSGVFAILDHRHLNEATGLAEPTAERLGLWLWERLRERLPALAEIGVSETPERWVHYAGESPP